MSWSGFKKNVGRATTQVMMKTGHVEKTSDREYEVEERRFRTLESASLRLQKEAKGYLDSLRAMTASQMRIAETIDAFYGDSGARDGVSRSYKQAVEDLDAETIKALDGPYRCVPAHLHKYAYSEEEGAVDVAELRFIEWQMNQGRKHTHIAKIASQFGEYNKLMDFVYRTTVLEPINRFCAYFPDINECIKKRNHKMLDYDALRSKVKKLTEKPDKDASKLPRTEKELEMVSVDDFLSNPSKRSADLPLLAKRGRFRRAITHSTFTAPTNKHNVTSLPKHSSADRSISQPLPPTPKMPTTSSFFTGGAPTSEDSPSIRPGLRGAAPSSTPQKPTLSRSARLDVIVDHHLEALKQLEFNTSPAKRASMHASPRKSSTSCRSDVSSKHSSISSSLARSFTGSAPFFNPAELEKILQPVKEDIMRKEADTLSQAKQAYDQLNEQLSTELPQLIDLRVPYLDPSFEALVKIQLRFCAEAYSRMAQVQQYLDASTRDQYASGELDARVEDVLGQIRELSIAGTV